MEEKQLVANYALLREEKDRLEKELSSVNERLSIIEGQLVEHLESIGADTTAKYSGIGHISLGQPRLYASYTKDNEEKVFEFMRKSGHEDVIKTTIHGQTLSAIVREMIENGKEMPEFINSYIKQGVRFYKK